MVENKTGKSIKCLRTDNGGEFTSLEFEQFCKDEGIVRHKTAIYTPHENGVVERMNQTLMENQKYDRERPSGTNESQITS